MKRIIWHWTGGADGVTDDDKQHYHHIIDDEGNVFDGVHDHQANDSTKDGIYAAHTRGANEGSIGIAIDAMACASESDPWNTTKNPPTEKQVDALCQLTARLCLRYGIPVSPKTTLNHGEVQANLKIEQRGKWDICRLPWVKPPENAGDWIRARTQIYLTELTVGNATPVAEEAKVDIQEATAKAAAAKKAYDEAQAALAAAKALPPAGEDVSVVQALRNSAHLARTGVDLEPGKTTSEMVLVRNTLAAMIAAASFFGVVLPPEKIDALVKLWEPLVALLAVALPSMAGFRTWRKNSNEKTKAIAGV